MKKNVSSVLVDNDVFDFLNEIKRQLSTNWVYLHFNVLKATEECNYFEGYEYFKQLNRDGSCTEVIKVTFKKAEDESVCFYMENCKFGELTYYVIHSLKANDEKIIAPAEPEDAIFYN